LAWVGSDWHKLKAFERDSIISLLPQNNCGQGNTDQTDRKADEEGLAFPGCADK
jgi:hypothetical protein